MFNILKKIIPNPFGNKKQNSDSDSDDVIYDNHPRKKEDDPNLQILEFTIDPMENVPRLFMFNGRKDEELTEFIVPKVTTNSNSHDGSPRQQSKSIESDILKTLENQDLDNYLEYKVTNEDTLYLICDKFNINVGKLRKINDIAGEDIFSGQILKIPKQCMRKNVTLTNIPGDDTSPKEIQNQESKESVKKTKSFDSISYEYIEQQKEAKEYQCYYCTGLGHILGKLSIQNQTVVFNPDYSDPENLKKIKKRPNIKFQASIDIQDINEAITMALPQITEKETDQDEMIMDYAVQISLSTINKQISTKYMEKLLKLKKEKKSISFISFKIYEYNMHGVNYSEQEKKIIADHIVSGIQNLLKKNDHNSHQNKTQTIVPFYDILYDNLIDREDANEKQKKKKKNILEIIGVIPQIHPNSKIVSKDQFLDIIMECVPSIYQLGNWRQHYSSWDNGQSFNTMLRNCDEACPLIILVQEYCGNVFGAYLTDPIHTGFQFYGKGECCVFRFEKLKNLETIDDNQSNSSSGDNMYGKIQEEENKNQDVQKHYFLNTTTSGETKQEQSSEEEQEQQQYQYEFKFYNSTGDNINYQFCDHDGLGIGCGEYYSIFIKSSMTFGSSQPSTTFDSPQLSTKQDFEIKNFEVWGLEYN